MKRIITIGREFGAGGGELGRRLARELDIAYYDRDIILKTAKASAHLTPEQVRRWDERVPHEFGFTQSLFNFYNRPLSEELWDAQVRAIREIADRESCVIVGRNADYILREFDHCLRVFVHADRNWRLLHMRKLMPDTPFEQLEADMDSGWTRPRKFCCAQRRICKRTGRYRGKRSVGGGHARPSAYPQTLYVFSAEGRACPAPTGQ